MKIDRLRNIMNFSHLRLNLNVMYKKGQAISLDVVVVVALVLFGVLFLVFNQIMQ